MKSEVEKFKALSDIQKDKLDRRMLNALNAETILQQIKHSRNHK